MAIQAGVTPKMPPFRRRHLPSLGAFATFEVAAKHLSFTLAGKELNVTQGAISQQIRQLESALDTQLFIRKHNALELTDAGRLLLGSVTEGLDAISASVLAITGAEEPQHVTISATDAMARYWLGPRIRAFRDCHPEVGFTVLASDSDDTFRNYAQTDMSLLCGNERSEAGEEMHFLCAEVAQPVCTPAFLDAHGPFRTPEQLNAVNLLHLHESHWSAEAIGWHPLGWTEWFRAQGAQMRKAPSSLSTNKVSLLLDACLAGDGVMLGFPHLVEQHLNDGSLVTAHEGTVSAGRGNFLICRQASLRRPEVALFRTALLDSLGA